MKLRFLTAGMVVWSAGLSTTAFAGDDDSSKQIGIRSSYDACLKRADVYTNLMLNCDHQEGKYQDRRLNIAYKKLMASLPSERRVGLKEKERDWLKQRENKCAQTEDNGSMGAMNSSGCFLTETATQATNLENMLYKSNP